MSEWGGADCTWTGFGQIGPTEVGPSGEYMYGAMWIAGEFWNSLPTWLHETGHNLYLGHAGKVRGWT